MLGDPVDLHLARSLVSLKGPMEEAMVAWLDRRCQSMDMALLGPGRFASKAWLSSAGYWSVARAIVD